MDISIDLETLAKTPDAFISAVGATAFDINTGVIAGSFYLPVSLKYEQPGRRIDPDTVRWWLTQGDAARGALTDLGNTRRLPEVMASFVAWVYTMNNPRVWGNGSTFDISILENALNYRAPWKYYNVMDMRSVLAQAKSRGYRKPAFTGVKHNAQADSEYQAKVIHECWVFGK